MGLKKKKDSNNEKDKNKDNAKKPKKADKEDTNVKKEVKEKKETKEIIEATNEYVDQLQAKRAAEFKIPERFWQKEEVFKVLLDPSLVKSENLNKYDISKLLLSFTEKMLQEELIDFRITGLAINNAAKLYHKKIKDVIDEEEKIQIKEMRERAKREIPRAMPQPLREPRKVATSDELFEAMRAAIIETMQKRELLRIRRQERIKKREELKILKTKGALPKELLKHLTGQEESIEEQIDHWLQKIKAKSKLNKNHKTSYFELCHDVIDLEVKNALEKKLKYINLFIAMMFLSTQKKIILTQEDEFSDIIIEVPKYIV